jgi:hypothetical protein
MLIQLTAAMGNRFFRVNAAYAATPILLDWNIQTAGKTAKE